MFQKSRFFIFLRKIESVLVQKRRRNDAETWPKPAENEETERGASAAFPWPPKSAPLPRHPQFSTPLDMALPYLHSSLPRLHKKSEHIRITRNCVVTSPFAQFFFSIQPAAARRRAKGTAILVFVGSEDWANGQGTYRDCDGAISGAEEHAARESAALPPLSCQEIKNGNGAGETGVTIQDGGALFRRCPSSPNSFSGAGRAFRRNRPAQPCPTFISCTQHVGEGRAAKTKARGEGGCRALATRQREKSRKT